MTTAHDLTESLPAAWYRDDDQWQAERRAIFARTWWLVGRKAELAEAGAWKTAEVAGWPVFVLRDRDGNLNGFHNVCRHRAGPLFTEGAGRCQALRCRYHGWLYGFDGSLRTAPGFPAGALDKSQFGLWPVKVETWRGLVFANLDLDASPVETWLGDIVRRAEAFPPVESLHFFDEKTAEGRCDWKAYGDNSCEGYHLAFVHGALSRAVSRCDISAVEDGAFVAFDIEYGGESDVRNDKGLWIYKFPGLLLHFSMRGLNVEQVEPQGPGAMRLRAWWWFDDVGEGTESINRASVKDGLGVIAEDMGVCERVQKNLEAGRYESGRLSPQTEPGTIFFQARVREALAAGAPAAMAAE